MTITELIERVKELDVKATKGPWGSHEGHVYSEPCCRGTEPIIGDFAVQAPEAMFTSQSVSDAHFAAQSRTLLPLCARLIEIYERYRQEPFTQSEAGKSIQSELAEALGGKP